MVASRQGNVDKTNMSIANSLLLCSNFFFFLSLSVARSFSSSYRTVNPSFVSLFILNLFFLSFEGAHSLYHCVLFLFFFLHTLSIPLSISCYLSLAGILLSFCCGTLYLSACAHFCIVSALDIVNICLQSMLLLSLFVSAALLVFLRLYILHNFETSSFFFHWVFIQKPNIISK